MSSKIKINKFIIIGFVASFSLLGIYFAVLSIANSLSHAISQFSQMWYWILPLVAGFGLQAGLYFYIRESIRQKKIESSTTAIAASGGISAGSMVACCLHHLADVLPLLGLTAAAVFLAKYQLLFIIVGIFSNFIGIIIMLEIIQKNELGGEFLKRILVFNMARAKKVTIGLSLVLSLVTFFLVGSSRNDSNSLRAEVSKMAQEDIKTSGVIRLPSRTEAQGGVSFEVTPLDFTFDSPIIFEIKIDTHSGSLDFEMTEISTLLDDRGNELQALKWEGSPPGGHHRSGTLFFPKLNDQAKKMKLIIEYIPLRIFKWDLE